MPSAYTQVPDVLDGWNLDNRYGKERRCLRLVVAKEMARVDELFEKAEVKPGDKFEVYYKSPYYASSEPEWRQVPGSFLEVDNGRLIVAPNCCICDHLASILDVRKVET